MDGVRKFSSVTCVTSADPKTVINSPVNLQKKKNRNLEIIATESLFVPDSLLSFFVSVYF